MIKFHCCHCGQKLGVPDEYAGHGVRCNKCNERSVVPNPAPFIPVAEAIPVAEPVQSPAVSSTEVLEEFEEVVNEIPDVEEDARQQALRQAQKARVKEKSRSVRGGGREKKSSRSKKDKTERLPLLDMVPDIVRLPLGIVFGLAGAGIMIGVWMMCAKGAGDPLCFMALFVPIVAAFGLRLPVVERTFLLGLLAVAIGALSIAGGKAIMAKYVVVPYFEAKSTEECLVDLPAVLSDPDLQFPSSRSIKPIATDGDYMTCIGLIALVDEGQADPKKVRQWTVHILQHSNKLGVIDFFDNVISGGGFEPATSIPGLTEADEEVMSNAYTKIVEWDEADTGRQMARKYYPALSKLINQANIIKTYEDEDKKYQTAFMSTLGLFDLVWVMLGLGVAYAISAIDV